MREWTASISGGGELYSQSLFFALGGWSSVAGHRPSCLTIRFSANLTKPRAFAASLIARPIGRRCLRA